jgi:hypothetical protein
MSAPPPGGSSASAAPYAVDAPSDNPASVDPVSVDTHSADTDTASAVRSPNAPPTRPDALKLSIPSLADLREVARVVHAEYAEAETNSSGASCGSNRLRALWRALP